MLLSEMIKQFEEQCPACRGVVWGNENLNINGLNLCNREDDSNNILSYATSSQYISDVMQATNIKGLIVRKEDKDVYLETMLNRNGILICTDKPEYYFYSLHEFLYSSTNFYNKFEFDSIIGENCRIDASAVIEPGVIIGNNVTIGALTVIKHGTTIEDNVTIGCNSTIGSEGFQLITDVDLPPIHATHIGGCHVSKNVYIGDNTCVCNSLFGGATFIGENVKIDNLVHIAHNLYIGKNAVVTAQVILCGSSKVEEGAWIAPNASVINRVTIGAYSKVGMGSVVTKNVEANTVVFGSPAQKHLKK